MNVRLNHIAFAYIFDEQILFVIHNICVNTMFELNCVISYESLIVMNKNSQSSWGYKFHCILCYFQGGLLRESTEMRLYSKLPDIGCSTTLPRPIDTNLLHSNHPASLDTNKPLRHHRTSSDVTDIVRPVGLQQPGLNDGKPLPRPAGHGPGLRLNTMRQLPPLRRHSIADAPHLERPHHPLPE